MEGFSEEQKNILLSRSHKAVTKGDEIHLVDDWQPDAQGGETTGLSYTKMKYELTQQMPWTVKNGMY